MLAAAPRRLYAAPLSVLDVLSGRLQLHPQFFFAGQVELVSTGEDCLVVGRQCHLNDGIVLLLAQQDPNTRVLVLGLHLAVKVVDVHLELPNVPMVNDNYSFHSATITLPLFYSLHPPL